MDSCTLTHTSELFGAIKKPSTNILQRGEEEEELGQVHGGLSWKQERKTNTNTNQKRCCTPPLRMSLGRACPCKGTQVCYQGVSSSVHTLHTAGAVKGSAGTTHDFWLPALGENTVLRVELVSPATGGRAHAFPPGRGMRHGNPRLWEQGLWGCGRRKPHGEEARVDPLKAAHGAPAVAW